MFQVEIGKIISIKDVTPATMTPQKQIRQSGKNISPKIMRSLKLLIKQSLIDYSIKTKMLFYITAYLPQAI